MKAAAFSGIERLECRIAKHLIAVPALRKAVDKILILHDPGHDMDIFLHQPFDHRIILDVGKRHPFLCPDKSCRKDLGSFWNVCRFIKSEGNVRFIVSDLDRKHPFFRQERRAGKVGTADPCPDECSVFIKPDQAFGIFLVIHMERGKASLFFPPVQSVFDVIMLFI